VNDTTCATGTVCALFQPFGFAGGIFDRETGLVRFGARDYDAVSGRWTQKDGAGFGGGRNFYVYAWNDPIDFVDATGADPYLSQYNTELGAAYAALQQYNAQSIGMGQEIGGYIFRNPNGTYSYTVGRVGSNDNVATNPADACGFPITGYYHTHPSLDGYYSGQNQYIGTYYGSMIIYFPDSNGQAPTGPQGTPTTGKTYYLRLVP
jgi:RHS repeat-associated protein